MFICHKCGNEIKSSEPSCLTCGSELQDIKEGAAGFERVRAALRKSFRIGVAVFAVPLLIFTLYIGRDIFGSTPLSLPLTFVLQGSSAASQQLAAPTVDSPTPIGKFIESDDAVLRDYSWQYRSKWSWEMELPLSLYDYYRELPRPPTRNYSVYVTHPLDDPYIDRLAGKMKNAAEDARLTRSQAVELAVTFVQNLPYTVDNVTTVYDEYPRYPVETLVDNGGDCEDTSILLASILDEMGYDVVLISPPGHFGVGVKDTGNMSGTYWEYKGEKYYYIETTGNNWRIGMIPDEYKNSSAIVYPLIPVPILTHNGNFSSSELVTQVNLEVANLGSAAADKVTVLVGFDAGNYMLWNAEQSEAFALKRDQQSLVKLQLRAPPRQHTRLVVQIIINGVLFDESRSGWFDT